MLLQIHHETRYDYGSAVDTSHHLAHLKPIERPSQVVLSSEIQVEPLPAWLSESEDVFGNTRLVFSLQSRHSQLKVSALSTVQTSQSGASAATTSTPAWDDVRQAYLFQKGAAWLESADFTYPSPHVSRQACFDDFSSECFPRARPVLDACICLMEKIHREMAYVSYSTDVSTPAHIALAQRQGVCQDFAHIMLSCIRSKGLSARYVSGYLLTEPAPGMERLIGSDASHAWVSLFVPSGANNREGSWIDLDPTNNRWGVDSPGEDYVTLAIGRDFADVSPVRGVIQGGAQHKLQVGVTVKPL